MGKFEVICNVRNEKGATLLELVLIIIILGVALPSIISIIGQVSIFSAKYSILDEAIILAEQKMEEIIAYKEVNWDWYKNINSYVGTENLPDNYNRSVSISQISNWGNANLDAWEVQVTVSHPQLFQDTGGVGYTVTTRFTKYQKP